MYIFTSLGCRSDELPVPLLRRGGSLVVHAAEDYYQILGVEKGADKKAIKSAYRQKVHLLLCGLLFVDARAGVHMLWRAWSSFIRAVEQQH